MTDTEQAGSAPAAQTRVQIDPMAALGETQALVDFYRNRNLLLANEVHALRGTVAELQARLAEHEARQTAAQTESEAA